MPTEPLDRFERLFRAAQMHPPDERAAFLEAACVDDPQLRDELESLLRADDDADDDAFLSLGETHPVNPSLPTPEGPSSDENRIGPYTILRRLGRGGMGDVFLALRSEPFKRYVALKVIRQGMDTLEVLQRFEMERQILAALDHPHIAQLLDGGMTSDGLPYFVMEYVDGVPITDYCDARRLSIKVRLELFQTVCRAVQYAHQNLVIHRDLKPSNILVTKDGTVKLLDFGIAKFLNPSLSPVPTPVTRTELRLMTPEYASPEQVRGATLTTTSDVYALGVILYELLSGHRPYYITGYAPHETMRVVCEQDPERPSTKAMYNESITHSDGTTEDITPAAVSAARTVSKERLKKILQGDLDNIVMMALRKETRRRYGSAEQLGQDLGRYLAGLPVDARPATLRYRMSKFVRRHQVGVAAALLATGGPGSGLGLALWQARQTRMERDRAEALLARAETVTGFMTDLFQASDPGEALGDTLTSYELLDRGVMRAEALAQEPETQAQLLAVVGNVYVNLGQYDQAQPLLERALAIRRRVYGEQHPDVAESLDDIAYLLDVRGEYDAAEPLYRDALQMRRTLGERSADVAESLNHLAGLLRRKGDYEAAAPLAREALALYRTLYGQEHALVAESLNNLALALDALGDQQAAESHFREALAMNRKLLGHAHPDVAVNLNNLASLLRRQGNYEAAERFGREALQMRRTIYGNAHPRVAFSLQNLASLLQDKGDLDEAETLFREALQMRRELLGPEHPRIAESLNGFALLRSQQGAHDEAETLMRESLAMRRRLLGSAHPTVAFSLNNLAVVLRRKGATAEAEALMRESLAMRRRLLGERHPSVARVLQGLASLLAEQGRPDEGEPLYQEALSIYRERFGEESRRVQEVYQGLVELYEAWGRSTEAERYRSLLSPPR